MYCLKIQLKIKLKRAKLICATFSTSYSHSSYFLKDLAAGFVHIKVTATVATVVVSVKVHIKVLSMKVAILPKIVVSLGVLTTMVLSN
jgi:hypothetical protein